MSGFMWNYVDWRRGGFQNHFNDFNDKGHSAFVYH